MLKNQKILITGMGKGIGRQIFLDLLKAGADVYGVTRSKKDTEELAKMNGNFKLFFGDISKL